MSSIRATTAGEQLALHRDGRHLRSFLDEYGKTAHGALLLHTGGTTEWLSQGVLSVPWWRVL